MLRAQDGKIGRAHQEVAVTVISQSHTLKNCNFQSNEKYT